MLFYLRVGLGPLLRFVLGTTVALVVIVGMPLTTFVLAKAAGLPPVVATVAGFATAFLILATAIGACMSPDATGSPRVRPRPAQPWWDDLSDPPTT